MNLSPVEKEKLLVFLAAQLCRKAQSQGLETQSSEALAILTFTLMKALAMVSVAELMSEGTQILNRDDVMQGVPEMIHELQVEATFPDGTKLITVKNSRFASGTAGSST
ncbi:MAG: urease subunit gamma [Cyanobacteriota/Melainabacteria group bacterium]